MLQSSPTWTHSSSTFEAELLEEPVNLGNSPKPSVEAGEGGHSTHPSVVATSEDSCYTNAVVNCFLSNLVAIFAK